LSELIVDTTKALYPSILASAGSSLCAVALRKVVSFAISVHGFVRLKRADGDRDLARRLTWVKLKRAPSR